MPRKRFSTEQIVTKLRQAEVEFGLRRRLVPWDRNRGKGSHLPGPLRSSSNSASRGEGAHGAVSDRG